MDWVLHTRPQTSLEASRGKDETSLLRLRFCWWCHTDCQVLYATDHYSFNNGSWLNSDVQCSSLQKDRGHVVCRFDQSASFHILLSAFYPLPLLGLLWVTFTQWVLAVVPSRGYISRCWEHELQADLLWSLALCYSVMNEIFFTIFRMRDNDYWSFLRMALLHSVIVLPIYTVSQKKATLVFDITLSDVEIVLQLLKHIVQH